MEIGRLTEADLPALAGLYKQFWGEDSCLEKMRATFRRLRGRPDYIFLAAKNDGRLVGSVLGIVCEELYGECVPFMVVEDVIVDAEWRRQGIGSALMCELDFPVGSPVGGDLDHLRSRAPGLERGESGGMLSPARDRTARTNRVTGLAI